MDVLRDALSLARYMFSFYSTSLSVSVHPTLCSTFPLDCLFIDVIEYVCAFRNVCVCVCVYMGLKDGEVVEGACVEGVYGK